MHFAVFFTFEKLEHTYLKRLFDTNLFLCVQNAYFEGKQSRYPRLNIAALSVKRNICICKKYCLCPRCCVVASAKNRTVLVKQQRRCPLKVPRFVLFIFVGTRCAQFQKCARVFNALEFIIIYVNFGCASSTFTAQTAQVANGVI